jgi:uncharacterized membrane protein
MLKKKHFFQIKLLQGAANAYHIETLPRFAHWFQSVDVLDERESFEQSCEIEPNTSASKTSQKSDQVRSADVARLESRAARFFLVQSTKTEKICQMSIIYNKRP